MALPSATDFDRTVIPVAAPLHKLLLRAILIRVALQLTGIMYKAIFFDAGSTLIDARLNREERFLHFVRQWALGVDPQAAQDAHRQAFQTCFGQGFPTVTSQAQEEALWLTFYRNLLASLGLSDPDDTIARRLVAACDWLNWVYVYDGVVTVLEKLQGRFKLGLISNAPPTMRRVLHDLGLARYFDNMVISGEVGVSKPDLAIFRLALEGLGVAGFESLFVDDMEENLTAAKSLGMGVLLIDYKNVHTQTAFPRIARLECLMEFI